ncbi:MAG: NUDIX hydrolase [Planctomycetes bacterium]|nr:NUDIX hydrolase [Planctomycetota bacterium]
MPEIKTVKSKIVYKNKWMSVREDEIIRPSGNSGIYGVVDKPHFAVVIPFEDNHVYCVEQYRYPVNERCLEFPQGAWESNPDMEPVKLAAAELQEETGLIAAKMIHVAFQYLASGYSSQGYHIYLATELSQSETRFDEEEENLITKKIPIDEFELLLTSGSIKDATTSNAYGLAKLKGIV